MSSPGQKRGSCGHAMASFDGHSFCARCREKGNSVLGVGRKETGRTRVLNRLLRNVSSAFY